MKNKNVPETNVFETGLLIGYMRVSKNDGSQIFDLQKNSLIKNLKKIVVDKKNNC